MLGDIVIFVAVGVLLGPIISKQLGRLISRLTIAKGR